MRGAKCRARGAERERRTKARNAGAGPRRKAQARGASAGPKREECEARSAGREALSASAGPKREAQAQDRGAGHERMTEALSTSVGHVCRAWVSLPASRFDSGRNQK